MSTAAVTPNTHHVVLDFGKHRGVLLTRIPVGYLRWMANSPEMAEKWRGLAKAEITRRHHQLPTLELSPHAIDNASLRVRKIWHETALSQEEGLYSWLMRVTQEAIDTGTHDGDKLLHLGMAFVVEQGEEFPVLKTIMPSNKGRSRSSDTEDANA